MRITNVLVPFLLSVRTITAQSSSPVPPKPVSYSGPGITGTAQLPPALSSLIFPTNSIKVVLPGFDATKPKDNLGENALPQVETNGDSTLGTIDAPTLPQFVGGPGMITNTSSAAQKRQLPAATNPFTRAPRTNVIRSYTFTVSRAIMAPDGVERQLLVINNQFPGPTIEANWGDTIVVTVINRITGPEEGTSLHWHGLLQMGSEHQDGVPGITQCPIAPGQSFTYRFQADLWGTSWWHSHFSSQYAGGAFGAMIIHGPDSAAYDTDLGPVLLTDYYHDDYNAITRRVMGTDLSVAVPFSQNNLINGKNNYDCSLIKDGRKCTNNAGFAKFKFTSGKTHRLRLINAGVEAIQRFSVDGHELQVVAYDFIPIVPYTTKVVTLGVGQRADVVIKATGNAKSSYWLRSTISTRCSLTYQPDAYGIIYYENANTNTQPRTTGWPIDDSSCSNDDLTTSVPYFPLVPPALNSRIEVDIDIILNSTGNLLWTIDGSSFRANLSNPILPLLQNPNAADLQRTISSFPRSWNIYNTGQNKSFVIVVNNKNPVSHPMHIHGHNMYVLAQGRGKWNGRRQGDPNNPTRRDVVILPPSGYIAVQIDADNPGIWPFHCHIAWHVSGGLYMNILERPTDIVRAIKTPKEVSALCTSWAAWTKNNRVNQVDAGLKVREFGQEQGFAHVFESKRDFTTTNPHLRRHVHAFSNHHGT